ncbi:NAD(P)-dependent dehydrogenase (short-subunit alcohol dehydrogenase family) [Amycolatopsis bartoniae]|uniref:3-oxoacyl-ACP reductase n=1 Tax=Amycolatopsis bartoniae TaxID=941986 RepID=A0A8H9MDD8_9PSEU|nr:SDR family NAD(P)-dependent oxidoreductase [Amycolatopsis bartoniae]MBB2936968.1 NAD(P)-dependent dehydrogenase (short-subunit alcohol dehydrogenase family) [Amycolatopsis bartoniae]TVT06448.1 SDR family NAD(P)-dependent oxidoreductase [Amycolatopsis bartoniae]GHF51534.1 3-oxoacyl-ACP reductase [Amycolatopsis bartoniae]
MTALTTVAITGATDGLGRALALRLARDPDVRLVLHGRDPAKLARVAAEAGGAVTVTADLADLAQVARLAEEIGERAGTLDVLVNNAGIGSGEPDGRERRTSRDGHELRFAVNYLAAFLLTENLLPLLTSSAREGRAARVVHVASLGQHPLDFGDLMLERAYSGTRAYGQSKLAQIMHCFDLAGRFAPARLTATCLHPGTYMPTKIVLSEIGSTVDSLESGVEAVRSLAVEPALEGTTGEFFDRLRPARVTEQAYDEQARAALRARSLALVEGFLKPVA